MNKIINVFFIASLLLLVGTVSVPIIKTLVSKTQDIQKLDLKFGTAPKHPTYSPIVHLAYNDGQPFCTAFVIDAHYAATAAHCIDAEGKLPKYKFRFLDENGKDMNVEVSAVGFDERTDLGLLQGNFNNFKILKSDFRNHGFFPGVNMLSCGYPFGLTWTSL